jgi:Na+-transporting NADH:ubiquinone oxidoreductase subunit NqrE
MKHTILPILLATAWISLSEFIRNEFLLKEYWTAHYSSMGLTFPSEPVNGAIWGLWSLLFAIFIYLISRRFSFHETALIAWLGGFVLMWIVTGNMAVLPFKILYFAIPLSLLEVYVATWIIEKLKHSTLPK